MLWYYKKLIDKYDVISFDVFDTLVERDVLIPTDVYRNIGVSKVGKKDAEKYRFDRMHAEEIARRKRESGEVSLKEIYDCFTPKQASIHCLDDEISYEIEHCRVKKSVYKLYHYAICTGKKIVLVSDMYLISKQMETILKQCGVEGYSHIFISSEYGKSKNSGFLFDEVMNIMGCTCNDILHFGDSIKSDFRGARKAGICGRLILRKNLLVSKMKSMAVRIMFGLYKRMA